MFVERGDKARVITGEDRNKEGVVLVVFPKKDEAVVEGVSAIKGHQRPSQAAPQGGIVRMEALIHVSNVMMVDSTGVAGRVDYKEIDDKKVRVSKKASEVLDK